MDVLLVLHDVSLSGAPKSILLVFEQLKKKGYTTTTVSLQGGGKLEQRFKDLSTKYYRLDSYSRKTRYTFLNRLQRKFFGKKLLSEYDELLVEISSHHYDCIYVNTVVSLSLGLVFKKKIGCKLIVHIHELDTVISQFHPFLHNDDVHIDSYIVPSYLNKKCLIEKFELPISKIFVVRETTDTFIQNKNISKESTPTTILMCGGAYWRKGDDLFLLIAHAILKKEPSVQFFWVGYQSDERRSVNEADIEKLRIKDSIVFINETDDPIKWYLQSDIFLLSSREDPFPLAAIDAGMLGLPIFCFESATGISEVIDASCVIPYLDIELMANRILDVIKNKKERELFSVQNRENFKDFNPKKISNEIALLIES